MTCNTCSLMLSKEDWILIKSFHLLKGYTAGKLMAKYQNFLVKTGISDRLTSCLREFVRPVLRSDMQAVVDLKVCALIETLITLAISGKHSCTAKRPSL